MLDDFEVRVAATRTTSTGAGQPPLLANIHSKAHSSGKGKQPVRVNSEHVVADEYSNTIGKKDNVEQITIRLANKAIQHNPSTNNDSTQSRQLPNEIVSSIINHLDGHQRTLYECLLVTKLFHAIATPLLWKAPLVNNPLVWREFDFWSANRIASLLGNPLLSMVGRHIRVLRLSSGGRRFPDRDVWPYGDDQILSLLPHITFLKHLTIGGSMLDSHITFQLVTDYCRSLTSLQLDDVSLTKSSFTAIGQHCHQLCDLEWTVGYAESPEWLACLTSCPLKCLKIDFNNAYVKDVTFNRNAATAIKAFDQLICLTIAQGRVLDQRAFLFAAGSNTSNNSQSLNNGDDTKPSSNPCFWPQMTKLTLHPTRELRDTTFIDFIKRHSRLCELDLKIPEQLTDTSLDAVALWLPTLTHLAIHKNDHISPNGVRRFVENSSSNLVIVRISNCDKIVADDFPETNTGHGTLVRLDRKVIQAIKRRHHWLQTTQLIQAAYHRRACK